MVKHILSDGREVQSMEGVTVPIEGPASAVYQIVTETLRKKSETVLNKEEQSNVPA